MLVEVGVGVVVGVVVGCDLLWFPPTATTTVTFLMPGDAERQMSKFIVAFNMPNACVSVFAVAIHGGCQK